MKVKNLVFALTGAVIRIAVLVLAIFFIMQTGKKAYDFGYRIFTEEPMSAAPGRDVTLNVTSDDSESDIANMLQEKGLIRDALLFRIQKKLSVYKGSIDPGTYQLNTSMNTDEMLEVMVGKSGSDSGNDADDVGVDELDPAMDDLTGLETAGVLADDEEYDEAAAFAEEEEPIIDVVEEGDETSAEE